MITIHSCIQDLLLGNKQLLSFVTFFLDLCQLCLLLLDYFLSLTMFLQRKEITMIINVNNNSRRLVLNIN